MKYQGRSEGASSVAFKVLIIKSEIDFINLFIFNCLTSNIQLFNVKFLFSEEHIVRKQKRTVVYGRASLVSGFQLTRGNDHLLSSRHKQIFAVPHPVHEDTKIWISNKRYRTNTA